MRKASANSELCQECALCCNGVLFVDVKLQYGETPAFEKSGIQVCADGPNRPASIPQPCPALKGRSCSIYADRPEYCRTFECALLKRVHKGQLDESSALKLIRGAQSKVAEVGRLMRLLDNDEAQIALPLRFKKLMRDAAKMTVSRQRAQTYAELTVAMHRLNLVLSAEFYPGKTYEA